MAGSMQSRHSDGAAPPQSPATLAASGPCLPHPQTSPLSCPPASLGPSTERILWPCRHPWASPSWACQHHLQGQYRQFTLEIAFWQVLHFRIHCQRSESLALRKPGRSICYGHLAVIQENSAAKIVEIVTNCQLGTTMASETLCNCTC